MAVLKLHLDEFDEIDYDLIAIHSVLEDYRLAYFINQKLPIILSKCKEDLSVTVKEGEAFFSKFTFDDSKNGLVWCLLPNKNEIIIENKPPAYDNTSSIFPTLLLIVVFFAFIPKIA